MEPRLGIKQIVLQVYEDEVEVIMEDPHSRRLLSVPSRADAELEKHQPIRIFLNYDAVGHSTDRDCHSLHDVVKVNTLLCSLASLLCHTYLRKLWHSQTDIQTA
jgi:hypothetical protein